MMLNILKKEIVKALPALGVKRADIKLEYSENGQFGDYSSNIAMILSKKLDRASPEVAAKIKETLLGSKIIKKYVDKIEVAGPGFLNFYLKREVFVKNVASILKEKENYGKNKILGGKKIMVDYTDPNPFKEFHIGHLMSNAIGESIARILEFSGAEVKRANYQGDVGLHVAKAIWNFKNRSGSPDSEEDVRRLVMGEDYAKGNAAYEKDEKAKKSINETNRTIYEKSDKETGRVYEIGRKKSLEYFEEIYKRLGTKFDFYFFESEVSAPGKAIIAEYLKKGVFEKSDGAIIFKGEKYGLHTRVFLTSEGLPTYEAKELGLAKAKSEKYPFDISISVTGNEQIDYFKVVLKAMEIIFPDIAPKIRHIPHGLLRLSSGKMSSRTGDVIPAETLLGEVYNLVYEKSEENKELSPDERKIIADIVAVGAIKYSILKQSIGRDIVFDFDKTISLEGDSGPYLQYAYVRAKSVLEKASEEGVKPEAKGAGFQKAAALEKMIFIFPEIVLRSAEEYAPQHLTTFLTKLASEFNSFYAKEKIVDKNDSDSPYKTALTKAVAEVLKNGLRLLGIQAPERM